MVFLIPWFSICLSLLLCFFHLPDDFVCLFVFLFVVSSCVCLLISATFSLLVSGHASLLPTADCTSKPLPADISEGITFAWTPPWERKRHDHDHDKDDDDKLVLIVANRYIYLSDVPVDSRDITELQIGVWLQSLSEWRRVRNLVVIREWTVIDMEIGAWYTTYCNLQGSTSLSPSPEMQGRTVQLYSAEEKEFDYLLLRTGTLHSQTQTRVLHQRFACRSEFHAGSLERFTDGVRIRHETRTSVTLSDIAWLKGYQISN